MLHARPRAVNARAAPHRRVRRQRAVGVKEQDGLGGGRIQRRALRLVVLVPGLVPGVGSWQVRVVRRLGSPLRPEGYRVVAAACAARRARRRARARLLPLGIGGGGCLGGSVAVGGPPPAGGGIGTRPTVPALLLLWPAGRLLRPAGLLHLPGSLLLLFLLPVWLLLPGELLLLRWLLLQLLLPGGLLLLLAHQARWRLRPALLRHRLLHRQRRRLRRQRLPDQHLRGQRRSLLRGAGHKHRVEALARLRPLPLAGKPADDAWRVGGRQRGVPAARCRALDAQPHGQLQAEGQQLDGGGAAAALRVPARQLHPMRALHGGVVAAVHHHRAPGR